jgi:hypothetical protein
MVSAGRLTDIDVVSSLLCCEQALMNNKHIASQSGCKMDFFCV